MTEPTPTPALISSAEFHRWPGVEAWRVTDSGPQATFLANSLAQAASLVSAVVGAAEQHGVLPDIDVRPEAVVVRVPNRAEDGIRAGAAPFAKAVSDAAAGQGLQADPARNQHIGIYVAQHSGADVRPFFIAALGYEPLWDSDAVDPLRCGPPLAFNPIHPDRPARGRTHFDVFVPADQVRERVDAALAAGGRLVDDTRAPNWWTLASPDNHGVDIAAWPDSRD